ncbi:polyprenyl synthetase family protein [Flavobacterium sp. xlx-214]|uniref:polyprenyl synthetase family protein n=1 Tax=unclassified Flavobacterium TaxID=196869 RepID=UPI0013D8D4CB|nr:MULTISPECIES: polyprenyl synthetase family protein [unclassified Flavobacterium]MBA5792301.1 polyprenyl synthetase family protein [Flavobacterium sp. xlx-221]QMI82382.1 polyprenyl synthetase family protein [Flavobacterium sp. xlx-214]
MNNFIDYKNAVADYINNINFSKQPKELYEPIGYIANLGGKRLRPLLTLFAAEVFGAPTNKAIHAAVAIELFHNFSLIHDDIMDEAPLRRGEKTVHEKWNLNTGILSGDAMLILAYQYFENYEPMVFKDLAKLFSKTALEVCEGQQLDINFETRDDVTIPEYIKMIEYKTAVLVGAALEMGAIVAQTSDANKRGIYNFGRDLGIAFQLQDDYLDAFGETASFGKQIGGDILENKKTYLYLKALQNASAEDKESLEKWFASKTGGQEKIEAVKALFEKTKATHDTQVLIEEFTEKGLKQLDTLDIPLHYKEELKEFAVSLMSRTV